MLTVDRIKAAQKVAGIINHPQRLQRRINAEFKNEPSMLFGEELAAIAEAKKEVSQNDRQKKLIELWANHTKDTRDEWAAAVRYNVNVDVLAQMWALGFFELASLANNEWPIIDILKRDGQFKVSVLGQNNGKVRRQFVDRRSHQMALLEGYTSEKVEWGLVDFQTGDIAQQDRVQQELVYEFNLGIDAMARKLLDANVVTSGLRAKLNLHKSIVAANLPDANYLDLNSVGNAGYKKKFTLEKVKQILDYFNLFAADVELDGAPLKMKMIAISSKNMRDFWDFATMVAGYNLTTAEVVDPKDVVPMEGMVQIWNSGKLSNLYGETFATVTRNTIAQGDAYAASNKPVGWYFDKPGFATSEVEINRQRNTGSMDMTKVHQFVMPDPWIYRYIKVKL